MKILHFLDTLNRGGAETLVLDVCRNAEKNKLDIGFAAAGGGAMETDFQNSGVAFFRFQRRLPFDFSLVAQLRRLIKDNKFDIVHAHQPVEAIHALAAGFGMKTKIVLTHHGIVSDRKNLLALKFVVPRVAHNITVGAASKKSYEEEFNIKFPPGNSVIYNGVDENRLKPSGADLRGELNISKDVLLIGMIGNFYAEARKDQLTLCRALPRVFAAIPNAHCIFAGKTVAGAEEKLAECVRFCAENNIADRVHFLGGRADVPDILAALDVFVCSSLKEGLPIAVNEAMLASVPAIVSDIEPLLEASKNGEFAEVFPVRNAEILSGKIIELLKNENRREDLAQRAAIFAKENFSIEAHLANLKKLYESVIKK